MTDTLADTAAAEARAAGWIAPDEQITATLSTAHWGEGVKREPLTYEREAPVSYFKDMVNGHQGDNAANARLARHEAEMRVELAKRDRFARKHDDAELETRVNPNVTPGEGGYFAPPLWLVEKFLTAKRPGRVLADLVNEAGGLFPLPAGCQSINIPLLTTGTDDAVAQDLVPDPDQAIVDTAKTSPVVTLSGQSDVALQLLEQSPPGAHLDWAIFKDLSSSYDADLEVSMLYGTGSAGQFTGVTVNAAAANQVTYTDASPTLSEMYPFIGQVAGQLGDNRNLPPEAWLMRTARWAWIGSSEDSSLRPIVPPELAAPVKLDPDGTNAVGSMLGWSVYCDDAVTNTAGATANADQIIAVRQSDFLLWEGTPVTNVFLEVLAGTLEARIQIRNYVAFIAAYPSSTATLNGTGMVVQSGF
jgi:HK97 family phage major capsid protein